jgi:hypothetical protein
MVLFFITFYQSWGQDYGSLEYQQKKFDEATLLMQQSNLISAAGLFRHVSSVIPNNKLAALANHKSDSLVPIVKEKFKKSLIGSWILEKSGSNWVLNSLDKPIPFNYTININSNYASTATKLAVAKTMIHELIHAYFLSLLDDYNATNGLAGANTLSSFPILWDYYVKNYTRTEGNITQHNQMATSFVDVIARALQEYHTGIAIANTAQPMQLYKDLAWGGLEKTKPFLNNDPATRKLTDADRSRINAVVNAEAKNATQTQNNNGVVTTHSPVGTPCN